MQIEGVRSDASTERHAKSTNDEASKHYEAITALLRDLDIDRVWGEATEAERRVLVDQMVEEVAVFANHLK